MTQVQTTLLGRLVRVVLWILLVWVPLALYMLAVGVEAISWSDIRGSVEITLLVYGWPIMLVGLVVYGMLAILTAIWKRWLGLIWPTTNKMAWPLAIGIGTYLLACLLHKTLPTEILYPFDHSHTMSLLGAESLYWWPFVGESQVGYTIYPPLDPRFVLSPTGEAACIKLATLVATLLCYWRYYGRSMATNSLTSAKSA